MMYITCDKGQEKDEINLCFSYSNGIKSCIFVSISICNRCGELCVCSSDNSAHTNWGFCAHETGPESVFPPQRTSCFFCPLVDAAINHMLPPTLSYNHYLVHYSIVKHFFTIVCKV